MHIASFLHFFISSLFVRHSLSNAMTIYYTRHCYICADVPRLNHRHVVLQTATSGFLSFFPFSSSSSSSSRPKRLCVHDIVERAHHHHHRIISRVNKKKTQKQKRRSKLQKVMCSMCEWKHFVNGQYAIYSRRICTYNNRPCDILIQAFITVAFSVRPSSSSAAQSVDWL